MYKYNSNSWHLRAGYRCAAVPGCASVGGAGETVRDRSWSRATSKRGEYG